jgi:hypothetical protein
MLELEKYPKCSELYIVEKAIIVVANIGGVNRQLRIEALRTPGRKGGDEFSTRGYIQESVVLQTSDIPAPEPETMSVWVDYPLPWTARDSADGAIEQALQLMEFNIPPR